jgi:hypothetical protein
MLLFSLSLSLSLLSKLCLVLLRNLLTTVPTHMWRRFIEFEEQESAQKAIANMNGVLLGGRQLRVNCATTSTGSSGFNAMAGAFPNTYQQQHMMPRMGFPGVGAMPSMQPQVPQVAQSQGAAAMQESTLSMEEEMSIKGNQRYLVMQKLARSVPELAVCANAHNLGYRLDSSTEVANMCCLLITESSSGTTEKHGRYRRSRSAT